MKNFKNNNIFFGFMCFVSVYPTNRTDTISEISLIPYFSGLWHCQRQFCGRQITNCMCLPPLTIQIWLDWNSEKNRPPNRLTMLSWTVYKILQNLRSILKEKIHTIFIHINGLELRPDFATNGHHQRDNPFKTSANFSRFLTPIPLPSAFFFFTIH